MLLIVAGLLVAFAVLVVIGLFIREGIEKRGYLRNRRRKPGRIPLH